MNKDARRNHHYHVIFKTKEEETLARVYNQWIKLHFPQVRIQLPTNYPVKVNRAHATAILDRASGRVIENTKEIVSDSNNGLKFLALDGSAAWVLESFMDPWLSALREKKMRIF